MALAYDQQTIQARSGGVDSLQQTVAQAVDAGDLIVVCASTFFTNGTGGTWVVTDDAGQTYTEASDVGADAQSYGGIFYKENHPGGTIKVTVNPNGTTADIDFTVSEVSGAATSSSLDKTNNATGVLGTGSTTPTVDLATLSQAAEIKFAVFTHTDSTRTLTSGTGGGFTQIGENESNTGGQCYNAEYEIVSSTADVTCNGTIAAGGTGGTWGICAASFKEAGAAATVNRILFPMGMDGLGGGIMGSNRIH